MNEFDIRTDEAITEFAGKLRAFHSNMAVKRQRSYTHRFPSR